MKYILILIVFLLSVSNVSAYYDSSIDIYSSTSYSSTNILYSPTYIVYAPPYTYKACFETYGKWSIEASSTTCTCTTWYMWWYIWSDKYCVPKTCTQYGNAHLNTATNNCSCDNGYHVSKDKLSCEVDLVPTPDEICIKTFWLYSISIWSNNCSCRDGYQWTKDKTVCESIPPKRNKIIKRKRPVKEYITPPPISQTVAANISTSITSSPTSPSLWGNLSVKIWNINALYVSRNSQNTNIGTVTLSAGTTPVTVTSLRVTRSGLGNATGISSIRAASNGTIVSSSADYYNATSQAGMIYFSPALVIPAGTSKSVDILVNLNGIENDQHQFTLTQLDIGNAIVSGTPVSMGFLNTTSYTN